MGQTDEEVPKEKVTEAKAEHALPRRNFLKYGVMGVGAAAGAAAMAGLGLRTSAIGTALAQDKDDDDDDLPETIRVATRFIKGKVPAGTDADPYPGGAIQAAIDDLPSTGGTVWVPAGVWSLPVPIRLEGLTDVHLQGSGHGTKLIPVGAAANVEQGAIIVGNNSGAAPASVRIIVSDFFVDGTNQLTAVNDAQSISHSGISIRSRSTNPEETKDITVARCHLFNTGGDSIHGFFTGQCLIWGNLVDSTRGFWASIHTHGSEHKWVITNNIIRDSAVGGIRHGKVISSNYILSSGTTDKAAIIGANEGCTIVGNFLDDILEHGIVSWHTRVVISGNHVNTAFGGKMGIVVRLGAVPGGPATDRVVVTDNFIGPTRQDGIWLEKASRCVVEGNFIYRPGNGSPNTFQGILLSAGSTRNKISGNSIWSDAANLPQFGIKEEAAVDDENIIESNRIEGTGTGAILKSGANSTVRRNVGHVTENRGTAVIANGTSSIVVAHGLAATPVIAIAAGRDLETDELRVSARDATNITLAVPANVTAARTVDWLVEA